MKPIKEFCNQKGNNSLQKVLDKYEQMSNIKASLIILLKLQILLLLLIMLFIYIISHLLEKI